MECEHLRRMPDDGEEYCDFAERAMNEKVAEIRSLKARVEELTEAMKVIFEFSSNEYRWRPAKLMQTREKIIDTYWQAFPRD